MVGPPFSKLNCFSVMNVRIQWPVPERIMLPVSFVVRKDSRPVRLAHYWLEQFKVSPLRNEQKHWFTISHLQFASRQP